MNDLAQIPLVQIPSSIQVVVPGKSDITLSQTGKYTIFYEYHSVVNNRIYSTANHIPGIQVSIVSTNTGSEIPLSIPSVDMNYTIGNRSGVGLYDFNIDKPGIYEMSASYNFTQGMQMQQEGQEIVLSIFYGNMMDKVTNIIIGAVNSILAIFLVPFGSGMVIIIITFLKRSKAKKTRELI